MPSRPAQVVRVGCVGHTASLPPWSLFQGTHSSTFQWALKSLGSHVTSIPSTATSLNSCHSQNAEKIHSQWTWVHIYTKYVDMCSYTACEKLSISNSNSSILFRFMNHQITIEILTKLDAQPYFCKNFTCIPRLIPWLHNEFGQIWEGSSVTLHHPLDFLTKITKSWWFPCFLNESKINLKKARKIT